MRMKKMGKKKYYIQTNQTNNENIKIYFSDNGEKFQIFAIIKIMVIVAIVRIIKVVLSRLSTIDELLFTKANIILAKNSTIITSPEVLMVTTICVNR